MSTRIEWTNETWNPVTGCTKVSAGCKHCYAERVWNRFHARKLVAKRPGSEDYVTRPFTSVRCHPERLDAPLHWRKPRMVFVNSMSDLFHEDVPFKFIDRVFAVMTVSQRHTFQVLTKRPERMLAYFSDDRRDRVASAALNIAIAQAHTRPTARLDGGEVTVGLLAGRLAIWPLPNVWLGVSVEDQATADERIPILLGTPAAVRWVSAEPLLGPVDFSPWLRRGDDDLRDLDPLAYGLLQMGVESGNAWVRPALDWIVAGGESGPGARPMHPDWPRAIRDQCAAAGVPFFFKQWGEWGPDWDGAMTCSSCGGTKFDWASPYEGIDICGQCGGDHWLDATTPLDGPSLVGKKRAGHLLDGREHREFPR